MAEGTWPTRPQKGMQQVGRAGEGPLDPQYHCFRKGEAGSVVALAFGLEGLPRA